MTAHVGGPVDFLTLFKDTNFLAESGVLLQFPTEVHCFVDEERLVSAIQG